MVQGCSLASHAQWLGQRFQKWCCSRVVHKLFCWILIAADLWPCHFFPWCSCWLPQPLVGTHKREIFHFSLRAVGILCFPHGGREVPLCLCSSWSTNRAFPLVVRDYFVKPLILWSCVSNSTLKSDLSTDLSQRSQGESLLKSLFPNYFSCCYFSFNYFYNLSQKKLKLILIEI